VLAADVRLNDARARGEVAMATNLSTAGAVPGTAVAQWLRRAPGPSRSIAPASEVPRIDDCRPGLVRVSSL